MTQGRSYVCSETISVYIYTHINIYIYMSPPASWAVQKPSLENLASEVLWQVLQHDASAALGMPSQSLVETSQTCEVRQRAYGDRGGEDLHPRSYLFQKRQQDPICNL